ncbi:uncharacterized protein SEPMUDRAFT_83262 [Sphaerulina musiva SO2202]|uniref:Uncharacterized protein n=1 Tax=Sphaerulina musiva (strain SO2202) TaxID=692275 RepID=M3DA00_SPHMS|nr:uncharacterized protein SEPMUDRAFT_83262 [Sphaerulina musiva SO2202]EMF14709.1 hypothetical protein SEPMUDRAFT_83262 [Sphaerulina musiva SO2202]
MAYQGPGHSVWSAMNYTPPRGRCNYKTSMISTCECLRYMLHPAATSFDCDGCGHHASFHSLENSFETAILEKWSAQQESTTGGATNTGTSKKRRRIVETRQDDMEILELAEDEFIAASGASTTRNLAGTPANSRASRKGAGVVNRASAT